MSTFYVNKYPIIMMRDIDQNVVESIPCGTIFAVEGIEFCMLSLRPVKKDKAHSFFNVDPRMLEVAFEKTDTID